MGLALLHFMDKVECYLTFCDVLGLNNVLYQTAWGVCLYTSFSIFSFHLDFRELTYICVMSFNILKN